MLGALGMHEGLGAFLGFWLLLTIAGAYNWNLLITA